MKKNRLLHFIFLFILTSSFAKEVDSSMLMQDNKTVEIYPNPFSENTVLTYILGEDEHVTVNVYDALGNLLQTVVDENQLIGEYHYKIEVEKSGLYYLQISRGGVVETKRMIKN